MTTYLRLGSVPTKKWTWNPRHKIDTEISYMPSKHVAVIEAFEFLLNRPEVEKQLEDLENKKKPKSKLDNPSWTVRSSESLKMYVVDTSGKEHLVKSVTYFIKNKLRRQLLIRWPIEKPTGAELAKHLKKVREYRENQAAEKEKKLAKANGSGMEKVKYVVEKMKVNKPKTEKQEKEQEAEDLLNQPSTSSSHDKAPETSLARASATQSGNKYYKGWVYLDESDNKNSKTPEVPELPSSRSQRLEKRSRGQEVAETVGKEEPGTPSSSTSTRLLPESETPDQNGSPQEVNDEQVPLSGVATDLDQVPHPTPIVDEELEEQNEQGVEPIVLTEGSSSSSSSIETPPVDPGNVNREEQGETSEASEGSLIPHTSSEGLPDSTLPDSARVEKSTGINSSRSSVSGNSSLRAGSHTQEEEEEEEDLKLFGTSSPVPSKQCLTVPVSGNERNCDLKDGKNLERSTTTSPDNQPTSPVLGTSSSTPTSPSGNGIEQSVQRGINQETSSPIPLPLYTASPDRSITSDEDDQETREDSEHLEPASESQETSSSPPLPESSTPTSLSPIGNEIEQSVQRGVSQETSSPIPLLPSLDTTSPDRSIPSDEDEQETEKDSEQLEPASDSQETSSSPPPESSTPTPSSPSGDGIEQSVQRGVSRATSSPIPPPPSLDTASSDRSISPDGDDQETKEDSEQLKPVSDSQETSTFPPPENRSPTPLSPCGNEIEQSVQRGVSQETSSPTPLPLPLDTASPDRSITSYEDDQETKEDSEHLEPASDSQQTSSSPPPGSSTPTLTSPSGNGIEQSLQRGVSRETSSPIPLPLSLDTASPDRSITSDEGDQETREDSEHLEPASDSQEIFSSPPPESSTPTPSSPSGDGIEQSVHTRVNQETSSPITLAPALGTALPDRSILSDEDDQEIKEDSEQLKPVPDSQETSSSPPPENRSPTPLSPIGNEIEHDSESDSAKPKQTNVTQGASSPTPTAFEGDSDSMSSDESEPESEEDAAQPEQTSDSQETFSSVSPSPLLEETFSSPASPTQCDQGAEDHLEQTENTDGRETRSSSISSHSSIRDAPETTASPEASLPVPIVISPVLSANSADFSKLSQQSVENDSNEPGQTPVTQDTPSPTPPSPLLEDDFQYPVSPNGSLCEQETEKNSMQLENTDGPVTPTLDSVIEHSHESVVPQESSLPVPIVASPMPTLNDTDFSDPSAEAVSEQPEQTSENQDALSRMDESQLLQKDGKSDELSIISRGSESFSSEVSNQSKVNLEAERDHINGIQEDLDQIAETKFTSADDDGPEKEELESLVLRVETDDKLQEENEIDVPITTAPGDMGTSSLTIRFLCESEDSVRDGVDQEAEGSDATGEDSEQTATPPPESTTFNDEELEEDDKEESVSNDVPEVSERTSPSSPGRKTPSESDDGVQVEMEQKAGEEPILVTENPDLVDAPEKDEENDEPIFANEPTPLADDGLEKEAGEESMPAVVLESTGNSSLSSSSGTSPSNIVDKDEVGLSFEHPVTSIKDKTVLCVPPRRRFPSMILDENGLETEADDGSDWIRNAGSLEHLSSTPPVTSSPTTPSSENVLEDIESTQSLTANSDTTPSSPPLQTESSTDFSLPDERNSDETAERNLEQSPTHDDREELQMVQNETLAAETGFEKQAGEDQNLSTVASDPRESLSPPPSKRRRLSDDTAFGGSGCELGSVKQLKQPMSSDHRVPTPSLQLTRNSTSPVEPTSCTSSLDSGSFADSQENKQETKENKKQLEPISEIQEAPSQTSSPPILEHLSPAPTSPEEGGSKQDAKKNSQETETTDARENSSISDRSVIQHTRELSPQEAGLPAPIVIPSAPDSELGQPSPSFSVDSLLQPSSPRTPVFTFNGDNSKTSDTSAAVVKKDADSQTIGSHRLVDRTVSVTFEPTPQGEPLSLMEVLQNFAHGHATERDIKVFESKFGAINKYWVAKLGFQLSTTPEKPVIQLTSKLDVPVPGSDWVLPSSRNVTECQTQTEQIAGNLTSSGTSSYAETVKLLTQPKAGPITANIASIPRIIAGSVSTTDVPSDQISGSPKPIPSYPDRAKDPANQPMVDWFRVLAGELAVLERPLTPASTSIPIPPKEPRKRKQAEPRQCSVAPEPVKKPKRAQRSVSMAPNRTPVPLAPDMFAPNQIPLPEFLQKQMPIFPGQPSSPKPAPLNMNMPFNLKQTMLPVQPTQPTPIRPNPAPLHIPMNTQIPAFPPNQQLNAVPNSTLLQGAPGPAPGLVPYFQLWQQLAALPGPTPGNQFTNPLFLHQLKMAYLQQFLNQMQVPAQIPGVQTPMNNPQSQRGNKK